MNITIDSIFISLVDQGDTRVSTDILHMLYKHARNAAKKVSGIIVEIGGYRGASTIALALGVRDAGGGKVISIPHIDALNEQFYKANHQRHLRNLELYEVSSYVSHICTDAISAARDWTTPIDFLWIDGDHSYTGVTEDIQRWVPFVQDHGLVIFNGHTQGSDVEAVVGEHLQFSRYRLLERVGPAVAFRKQKQPRKLYLCAGMQSSGSTLVSCCFLQRQDLDGVYDMENSMIHQDFSRVSTNSVWVKMTIGSFRLAELAVLYQAQGWEVYPLFVQRDLQAVIRSLIGKEYGFNGATGDDPPLYIRVQRYLADLTKAQSEEWPILVYEELMQNPTLILNRTCKALGLPWSDSMTTWPKPESQIAYMSVGSPSLRATRKKSIGLLETIACYQKQLIKKSQENETDSDPLIQALLSRFKHTQSTTTIKHKLLLLPPVTFRGTRRNSMEQELARLKYELALLTNEHNRILEHIVFGPLLRFWKRFINPFDSFEKQHIDKQ